MKDQSEKVKRGSTVTVRLTAGSRPAEQPSEPRRGALPEDADEDLYVFRKEGIKFYDLGMKLNEGGYHRILPAAFVPPFNPASPNFAAIDRTHNQEEAKTWRRAFETNLLDSALESTDGKPNRQPIPFAFENAYVDAFAVVESEMKKVLLGKDLKRAFLDRIYLETEPSPDHNKGWKQTGDTGLLKFEKSSDEYGIESLLFYCNLWSKAGFGFTETPEHDANSVDPPSLKKIEAIYLAPAMVTLSLAIKAQGFNPTYDSLIALDTFTNYKIVFSYLDLGNDGFEEETVSLLKQAIIDSGLYSQALAFVDEFIGGPGNLDSGTELVLRPFFDMEEPLAGVLKTKGGKFYCWNNNEPFPSETHPDAGIVGTYSPFIGRAPFVHGIFT